MTREKLKHGNLSWVPLLCSKSEPGKRHKQEWASLSAPRLQMPYFFPDSLSFDLTLRKRKVRKEPEWRWLHQGVKLGAWQGVSQHPSAALTTVCATKRRHQESNRSTDNPGYLFSLLFFLSHGRAWTQNLLQTQLVTTVLKNYFKESAPIVEFSGTIHTVKTMCPCKC